MNDKKSKKELLAQYKEREIIGGVYILKNTRNDKILLAATTDLQGSKNRFEFSQQTGSCVEIKLQGDWNQGGGGQFAFEVLEELKKSDTQTPAAFQADLGTLKDLWLDKLHDREFY